MGLTPIHKTTSVVSNEIGAVNIAGRAINTVTNTAGAVISRTSNALSKLFGGAGKILKNGLVAGGIAAAALTFPISAPAIYGALATGKFVKNKVEGKGRGESIGNAITRPLGADTVAKYTDFAKVGEGIKDMTIGAGGEVVKGAAELVTVPLIGAKFDESSNSGQVSQAVDSPSTTESPTPSPSTPPSNPEQSKKQETPIPIPTPSPSTPPSSSEQSKSPKEQKKEEENQKKEEDKKLSDDAKKKSENYGKSIDKITPKLDDTKNFIDANRKSVEKEDLLNEVEDRINQFGVVTNDYSVIYRNATSKKLLNNTKATEKPEDFYNSIIEIKNFFENKMLSDDGGFDKYDDIIIDRKNSISIKSFIRHIDNLANNIENEFYDGLTSTWKDGSTTPLTSEENKSLIGYQKEFGNIFMITGKGLEKKEKEFGKEIKKINDIKPSDLKNQENKIIEHISKLSSLLQTSKGKIAAEKGNFWSGKITSINTEYIKEISEEISELQNELGGLSSGGEKSVHRKDIEKQLSPLFGKINEAFQSLNT